MDFDDESIDIAERSYVRTSQSWAGEGAPWLVDGRSQYNVEIWTSKFERRISNFENAIDLYFWVPGGNAMR